MTAKQTIEAGKAILGIEFGSTRIKAVLIDEDNKPIAQGSHEWENQLVDGLWTYSTRPFGMVCRTAMPTSARMSRSSTTARSRPSLPSVSPL